MTGPLPSVSAMKKALLTVIAAIAWFLPGHLAIAALLVLIWGSAMASTANTAKTRAVETRVNGVITQLGTTNTNVTAAHAAATAAQSTANTANSAASSAQGTANTANSNASNAQSTANNAMPRSGGTFSGPVTCGSNLNVAGTFYMQGTGVSRQSSPGTISGTGTLSSLTNCCNAIIGQLQNTEWFA
jgi:trimeric autotransporter adhesin